jgi:Ca2+-binding EF-hand superfamily protein
MRWLTVTLIFLAAACSASNADKEPSLESTLDDAKAFVEGSDANGDGKLSYEEFDASTEAILQLNLPDREMRETFEAYDGNDDGYVTTDELRSLVRTAWK